MASSLSARVRRIELALSLLGEMEERLRCLRPSMRALMRSLSAAERFAPLDFVRDCYARMEAGAPFPSAWRRALEADALAMGQEEAELLASLGEVLGVQELESQLGSLESTRLLLQNRLERAREDSARHARLYRSLGLLGGLALAILLF